MFAVDLRKCNDFYHFFLAERNPKKLCYFLRLFVKVSLEVLVFEEEQVGVIPQLPCLQDHWHNGRTKNKSSSKEIGPGLESGLLQLRLGEAVVVVK